MCSYGPSGPYPQSATGGTARRSAASERSAVDQFKALPAKPNAARDAELPALAAYLAHVARASKGLSAFDHGKWRDVWKQIREGG